MSMTLWIMLGLAVAVLAAVGVLWAVRRLREPPISTPMPAQSEREQAAEQLSMRAEEVLDDRPVELTFGPSAREAALTVRSWGKASIPEDARPLSAEASYLSALGPILQMAPSVLTAAEMGSGQYMKVVVDGSLAAAKDGTFMPFVRGSNGKVTDLARLQDPDLLRSLINAAAVWQVATVIVAQKHLADITQHLKAIRDVLDEVLTFQKTERRSKILGAVQYFQEVVEVLGRGGVAPSSRQTLENKYAELTSIQVHLEVEIRAFIKRIPFIKGNERFGSEELFRQMQTHNETLTAAIEDWHQCVGARLMSWYILMCYAGEHQTKVTRLRKIEESVHSFSTSDEALAGIREKWDRRIDEADAFWNRGSTLEKRRANMRGLVEKSEVCWLHALTSVSRVVQRGKTELVTADQPIELAVRLDANGKVEGWQLADKVPVHFERKVAQP